MHTFKHINVHITRINVSNAYINVSNVYIIVSNVHINVSNVYINVCITEHYALFMPTHYPHINVNNVYINASIHIIEIMYTLSHIKSDMYTFNVSNVSINVYIAHIICTFFTCNFYKLLTLM